MQLMTEQQTQLAPVERAPRPIDTGVDIGHVHLKTADIDRVHRFYVGILGFDVIVRMEDALFVSAGGYHHHLGFNTWTSRGGSPPPRGTTGLYHVAIRYATRAALGDALRRLVDASWPLDGATDHGTHEALYLRDPDENGLELAWDRPPEAWPLDDEGHLRFVGARTERADENGMAHFLEHLVFKGGETYATYRDVNETAERLGAQLNAYTSHDVVAFHITCRAEALMPAVDLLTDFVAKARIDAAELDRERGVVIQEINRSDDVPSSVA